MIVYFARHGQTDYNVQRRIQGGMDVPLNDTGRDESALLSAYLKDVPFIEAHTSPLLRAYETAQIVVAPHAGLELQSHPDLIERRLGSLEGKVWTPGVKFPDDIEQIASFKERVARWVTAFLQSHVPTSIAEGSGDEKKCIVISHGAYLSTLLNVLRAPPLSFRVGEGVDIRKHCLNTCVMRVRVDYDHATSKWDGELLSWGEVEHLGDQARQLDVADDLRHAIRQTLTK